MKTKDRIMEVARKMISEIGYHGTTTAALAKEAGISEGTIYRHFENKEDILLHILQELDDKYSAFLQSLRSIKDGEPGTIERIVKGHVQFTSDNIADLKIVLSSYALLSPSKQSMTSVIERMHDFFRDCMHRSIQLGVIHEVNVESTAKVLVALLLGIIQLKLYWPEMKAMENIDSEAVLFTRRSLVKES
ncbi:MAG: TetR/AcrR family transcriptional regulator [Desulfovibrionaceae bacterium]